MLKLLSGSRNQSDANLPADPEEKPRGRLPRADLWTDIGGDMLSNHAEIRKREFCRLEEAGQTYLDFTGAALYPESLVRRHMDLLTRCVLGNPHSRNPSSAAATFHVEEARARVLEFFDADPAEYEVIFTANASGALKLIAESFPFGSGSRLVLTADNHNSVHGIREFARRKAASVSYVPLNSELRVDDLESHLAGTSPGRANLFAFPAQSNFSGVKHPLEWIGLARSMGYSVILDAAAFVPTSRLNLSEVCPDFTCLSFYKMFGYPTGVGALLARRSALDLLGRPWFAGGTVQFASVGNEAHVPHAYGRSFEDGTLNFLDIAAIPIGLEYLRDIGIDEVSAHVADLTRILLREMLSLAHSNGSPMVRIYGPPTVEGRGGTVAFNVLDPNGGCVPARTVEMRASANGVSLRSGFFCNPGAAEYALSLDQADVRLCVQMFNEEGYSLEHLQACIGDKPTGAVRVSIGLPTNERDVRTFVAFLRTFRDAPSEPLAEPTSTTFSTRLTELRELQHSGG
jgi:selenocysteine lyase/cysteine desulfurase